MNISLYILGMNQAILAIASIASGDLRKAAKHIIGCTALMLANKFITDDCVADVTCGPSMQDDDTTDFDSQRLPN